MQIRLADDIKLDADACEAISEQVCYIDPRIVSCRVKPPLIELELTCTPDDPEALTSKIVGLARKTERSYRKVRKKVVREWQCDGDGANDPEPHLRKTRQVIESAPGTVTCQGSFLSVLQGLDRVFRAYALDLGCTEQSYPTTVPLASLLENGYVCNFAHHLLSVSGLRRDLQSLESASAVSGADPAAAQELADLGDPPRQALSPTVCYHCFETLRRQELPGRETLFTAIGPCHRNEGTTVTSLRRLQTFTMREIVFFGAAEWVEATRQKIVDWMVERMQAWGVPGRVVTACDPFFAGAKDTKRSYQSLMLLKYELQLHLPFYDEWLAVASFNDHQKTLVDCYGITSASGDRLASGCVGLGYERLAYGLFARFGVEVTDWPEPIRSIATTENP